MIHENDEIELFLNKVCKQVKSRELHYEIRREVGSHLEQLLDDKESAGYTTKEAAQWALEQMGDPDLIGRELQQLHKPRMNWGLLLIVLFFAMMSLFAMWSIDVIYEKASMGFVEYTKHQLVYVIIGLLVMLGMYFWDYRKLKDYSWLLYGITIAGMIATMLYGAEVRGAPRLLFVGSVAIDWIVFSPYLLVLAISGILTQSRVGNDRGRIVEGWFKLLLIGLPCFIYVAVSTLPLLVVYMSVCIALWTWLTRRWLRSIWITAGLLLVAGACIWNNSYLRNRVVGAIDPLSDPLDSGYHYLQLASSMRSTGWSGHGLLAYNEQQQLLLHSDLFLSLLLNSFGWGVGLLVLGAVVLFLTRLFYMFRAVREPFGKTLIVVLTIMLAIPLLYGLAMTTGRVMILSLPFPFLSYGASHLLIEYAVVGLMLGIYRRKDMIALPERQMGLQDKARVRM